MHFGVIRQCQTINTGPAEDQTYLRMWIGGKLATEVDLEVIAVEGSNGHHVGVTMCHHL